MLVVAFMIAAIGGAVVVRSLRSGLAASHSSVTDMDGNAVAMVRDSLSPRDVDRMAVASTSLRFRVPSVGLDVPLEELSEVDGSIVPPGFTSAYLVRNRGVGPSAASSGTVYVVMHSVRGGRAPGNYLINVARRKATRVGGLAYVIDGSWTILKGSLASAHDVWHDVAGRLVVITCLQRTTGRSLDNVVITAHLEG